MVKLFVIFLASFAAAIPACLVYFAILRAFEPLLDRLRLEHQIEPAAKIHGI
jgi:hypothetical protein